MSATLLIVNARVLTMDPEAPETDAVALSGDRIAALGGDAEAMAGPECPRIDAKGATVLPGFIESHLHLFMGGSELAHLQLLGVKGPEALTVAIRTYAAANPDRKVIVGQGCDYGIYDRALTRHDLDAILPDRPVCLLAADHHTAWANTIALEQAGILHGAALGPGNEIVMENGLATGELREFEAKAPVLRLAGEHRIMAGIATGRDPVPSPTRDEMLADLPAMERGLHHCARHGFTSLVNMDGNRYTLEVLDHLRQAGRLTARVRVPYHFRNDHALSDLETASAMRADYNDDWLSSGFVKMFMDGVVDSGTAVMLNDYPDQPGWRGEPLHAADRFAEICIEADRRGLQIAVHAIGDGAVRRVLDGYQAARQANGARDARHRIEHIELIDRADIPRFAEMGVVASVQPSHPPGALDFPLFPTLDKIGRGRWRDAYLTRSLRDAGARIVFASDWPVADVNPLRSIQAAVTRAAYEGAQDETLPLRDALAAYTIGGAYAEHTEDRKGMLRPGYLADLVILSGDIEAVPLDRISTLSVEKTICGGRIVWDAEANPG
ncbi:MAG: amidohydrolase [Paracoccaceae bacterium]|nr:amidohydrolase [Paracoccaceae bacterium]